MFYPACAIRTVWEHLAAHESPPLAKRDIFRETLGEVLRERLGELFDEAVAKGEAGGNMGKDREPSTSDESKGSAAKKSPDIDPPTRDEVVAMFTLALFYLTSWEERIGGKGGFVERRAWKSADWDALDALREEGLVSCTNKAKSVTLTDAGITQAEAFLHVLDLGHLTR